VVTTQLMAGAWPILGLSVHNPDIEAAALPATNEQLESYGLAITRFGNLDVNLSDEDSARLKKLAGDTAYSRLAGGFLQAAQAEALQGAGEGMAKGGGADTPLFLGAGFGMANQMMQPPPQAAPQPPPAPGFAGGGPGYAPPPAQPPAPPPPAPPPPPARPPPPAAPRRRLPSRPPRPPRPPRPHRPRPPPRRKRHRPPRPPGPSSAATATARSARARSSAASAAPPCRSTAPTATPT
jgi:hypothetical protein